MQGQVCDAKIIPHKECISKHKLLVADMQFRGVRKRHVAAAER